MLISEFIQRTGFCPSESVYREIEAEYMQSDLDKDTFCKNWVKNGGILKASKKMQQNAEALFKYCQGVDFIRTKQLYIQQFNDLTTELRLKYL